MIDLVIWINVIRDCFDLYYIVNELDYIEILFNKDEKKYWVHKNNIQL